ncbi:response regulator receiver domain-containing protein [Stackebrandtia endophytica]|uniref:Response regulator receiver domain-containing protein n=1 Tax=Stackebrandtia endophytica TaxID=1496996 RepID=A0A543AY20_9ACTN|nr:response regulator [Stackebrandtia endophytica]TQL77472.1 response regulator receiver domain-containing protein [Stackebrandtia endophytica]
MADEVWVELIRVVPGVLWVGFALIVVFVARGLLRPHLGRLTRVETPVVSAEFAAEVLDGAAARAAADAAGHQPWRPRPGDAALPPGGHGGPPRQSGASAEEPDTVSIGAGPGERVAATSLEPSGGRFFEGRLPGYGAPDSTGSPPPPQKKHRKRRRPSADPHLGLDGLSPGDIGWATAARLAASTETLTGRRILWVDDHPAKNTELVGLLRSVGATVDVVVSSDEAFRVLTPRSHDLVISDMKRPGEGDDNRAGWNLVERMRQRGVDSAVILYTVGIPDEPRKLGVFGVTDNPYELVQLVIDVMERRRYAVER